MEVVIYKPSKNAMQSGRGKSSVWFLEYERNSNISVEPLMGWASSEDALNQVRLEFCSSGDAIAFAESKRWDYNILPENIRRVSPKNYSTPFLNKA